MNRLGLFKRAAGLVASPALLTLPPEWRALTPSEPQPEFVPGFVHHGYVSYPHMLVAGHTHNDAATHTHDLRAMHSHPIHSHCPMCLRREGHAH